MLVTGTKCIPIMVTSRIVADANAIFSIRFRGVVGRLSLSLCLASLRLRFREAIEMLLWQALKPSGLLAALSAVLKRQEVQVVDKQKTAECGTGRPASSPAITNQA